MKYIINDVGKPFSFPGVQVICVNDLTKRIQEWDGWEHLNPNTTRVVFPGNGAHDVRHRIGRTWLSDWRVEAVTATRFWWPNSNPVAVVGQMTPNNALDVRTTDIVVIDDVISSGATLCKLRERNEVWIPKARWHALAWIKQYACRLRRFESVFYGIQVGHNAKRVPINSLSTLLADESVAKIYAQRNFDDPTAFLTALHALR